MKLNICSLFDWALPIWFISQQEQYHQNSLVFFLEKRSSGYWSWTPFLLEYADPQEVH